MNETTTANAGTKRWIITALLVVVLVMSALATTAITNALSNGQALDQLKSYYIYLPLVFHK